MASEIERLKKQFNLELHPTGNSFKELWRSKRQVTIQQPGREVPLKCSGSSIYFLLEAPNFISWHSLMVGDEVLVWHAGGRCKIHFINNEGVHSEHVLGNALEYPDSQYQVLIPNNTWYAFELIDDSKYAFYSAIVMPGWEPEDWKEGKRADLIKEFPAHESLITKFTNE